MKTAVFDVGLAGCLSCKMAIEHSGKHIDGVKEIQVDLASHRINLIYEESKKLNVLDEIKEIVRKIGYEAKLIEKRDFNK